MVLTSPDVAALIPNFTFSFVTSSNTKSVYPETLFNTKSVRDISLKYGS